MTNTPEDPWKPGLYLLDEFSTSIPFDADAHPVPPRDPAAFFRETEALCFICKTELYRSTTANAGNYTKEDVFPVWLTSHFGIADDIIDYPDGTFKKYKQVLTPCCLSCNGGWMKAVEDRVAPAGTSPDQYAAFTQLSRSDIALWTIKLMYGLLYSRIEPWSFNSHKPKPKEISERVLDHMPLSLMLLDGFRKRVIISGTPFPSSIILIRIKPGATGPLAFDYQDSIEHPNAIAMRMGTVGLITVFEDFEATQNYYANNLAPVVGNNALHPDQFMEVAARLFDAASSAYCDVTYSGVEGPRDVLLRLSPYDPRAIERTNALYRRIAKMMRDPAAENWKPTGTLLLNQKGDFQDLQWPPSSRAGSPP